MSNRKATASMFARVQNHLAVVFLAALMCGPGTASAHRMPGSLTIIAENERTGVVEIMHRLHRHDAELGLSAVLGEAALTFDDLESRAELAFYIEQRFRIAAYDDGRVGEDLDLTLVGAELDGDFILVYQELEGSLPRRVAIRDDILRDVLPAQANQVNIESERGIRTLMFAGNDQWHPFDMNASAGRDS